MDYHYSELTAEIFVRWIIGNSAKFKKDGVLIEYEEINHNRFVIYFDGPEKYGTITVWYKNKVVEQQLYAKETKESIFYLHYEVNDIGQCHFLFKEFYKCLIKKRAGRRFRVLVSCTGGLTSCLFATKLQDLADLRKTNIRVDATAFCHIKEKYKTYDLILLAPQVAHQKAEAVKYVDGCVPVRRIDASDYAMMNLESTFDLICQLGEQVNILNR